MNARIPPHALLSTTRAPVPDVFPSVRPEAGPQDWEQLVSPGHVLGHRMARLGKLMFLPALAVFAVSWVHVLHNVAAVAGVSLPIPRLPLPVMSFSLPESVRSALTYDPNTYVDLQGGVRTSYRFAWLTDLPRSRGISVQAWTDLNGAVASDLAANRLETERWTATPALTTAPKVTRPAKALTEHIARLDTGIVTVSPATEQPRVHVVAMVDGAWAWATYSPVGCWQSFGPPLPKCVQSSAIPEINDLRPTKS